MINTAPFVQPTQSLPVQEEISEVEHILVTPDITQARLELCLSCENLDNNVQDIPKCLQCDCSISMLTTINFKTCPIGKW